MFWCYFQTLCALVRAVYRKRLGDHGFDIINILIGFDAAEAQMQVFCFCTHFIKKILDLNELVHENKIGNIDLLISFDSK